MMEHFRPGHVAWGIGAGMVIQHYTANSESMLFAAVLMVLGFSFALAELLLRKD
jgi:hypothetical protein